jgi:hypothetical protein
MKFLRNDDPNKMEELRVSDWLSEIGFFNMIGIDDESFA